mmetsp:Transcript_19374/g.39811  ORF Transcript_19374/g.39811 Transcript_19374/m.39811 type:complete len:368 (+) Transcript_19374:735-1838(+)
MLDTSASSFCLSSSPLSVRSCSTLSSDSTLPCFASNTSRRKRMHSNKASLNTVWFASSVSSSAAAATMPAFSALSFSKESTAARWDARVSRSCGSSELLGSASAPSSSSSTRSEVTITDTWACFSSRPIALALSSASTFNFSPSPTVEVAFSPASSKATWPMASDSVAVVAAAPPPTASAAWKALYNCTEWEEEEPSPPSPPLSPPSLDDEEDEVALCVRAFSASLSWPLNDTTLPTASPSSTTALSKPTSASAYFSSACRISSSLAAMVCWCSASAASSLGISARSSAVMRRGATPSVYSPAPSSSPSPPAPCCLRWSSCCSSSSRSSAMPLAISRRSAFSWRSRLALSSLASPPPPDENTAPPSS